MNTDRHSNVEKEFTNLLKLAVIFVGNINKIIEYNTCKCLRRIPFSLYLLLISYKTQNNEKKTRPILKVTCFLNKSLNKNNSAFYYGILRVTLPRFAISM